jgi:hypothetical protein
MDMNPQQYGAMYIAPLVTLSVWELCAPARAGDRSKRLKAIRRFIVEPLHAVLSFCEAVTVYRHACTGQ